MAKPRDDAEFDPLDEDAGMDLLKQIKQDYRGSDATSDVKLEQDVVAYFLSKSLTQRHGDEAASYLPKRRDMTFPYLQENYPALSLNFHAERIQSIDVTPLASAFYTADDSYLAKRFSSIRTMLNLEKRSRLAVVFRGSRKKDFSMMALHNVRNFPKWGALRHGFVYWPVRGLVLEPVLNLFERIGTGWIENG